MKTVAVSLLLWFVFIGRHEQLSWHFHSKNLAKLSCFASRFMSNPNCTASDAFSFVTSSSLLWGASISTLCSRTITSFGQEVLIWTVIESQSWLWKEESTEYEGHLFFFASYDGAVVPHLLSLLVDPFSPHFHGNDYTVFLRSLWRVVPYSEIGRTVPPGARVNKEGMKRLFGGKLHRDVCA